MYEKAVKGFYYVLWVLWLYKTQKWLFHQENALLGEKEQNRKNFDISQSLTKNATVDQKSQLLTTKVKTWQESRLSTRKSMVNE